MQSLRTHIRYVEGIFQLAELTARVDLPPKGATANDLKDDQRVRAHALLVVSELFVPRAYGSKQLELVTALDRQLEAIDVRLQQHRRRLVRRRVRR